MATAILAAGAALGLAACGDAEGRPAASPAAYRGVTVTALDAALFGFRATMQGRGAGEAAVAAYARCGAAGYALSRGFGFVRHVRTKVDQKGGIWTADAVYTISPGLPGGIASIDAEVAAADCAEQGIPTV
jgi:hypothetical protein